VALCAIAALAVSNCPATSSESKVVRIRETLRKQADHHRGLPVGLMVFDG